ncbi:MAG: ABC transporter permease subunit [Deltaproteobacteria bacterium]|nr:ABC transporter permease subunit [Deltaproteobacteria bacterium]
MRSGILTVYRKEMLEVLRDRKTLIFMIVLPLLLIPLLIQVTTDFVANAEKEAASATLDYVIFDGDQLPGLDDAFGSTPGFSQAQLADRGEIGAAVGDERIDFALVVQPPAEPGAQHVIELHYNTAPLTSKVKSRTKKVIEALGEGVQRDRLDALGVSTPALQQGISEPVVLVERSTAPVREVMGERIGGMLPYMFIIFCFLGAMYPAIDLAAGEKERGTLETLLLVPIPRYQVVVGKFLVVFTAGVVSATLSISGLGGWLAFKGAEMGGDLGGVLREIGATDLGLIAAMLVPTAGIFAALLLSISIYAKSFKEAQSYIAPLNMLIILPAFLAMLPGVVLDWKTASIPIANISLAIKELIKGTMDYSMLVAILGSSTALAGGLLVLSTWWFSRESVLFRQ